MVRRLKAAPAMLVIAIICAELIPAWVVLTAMAVVAVVLVLALAGPSLIERHRRAPTRPSPDPIPGLPLQVEARPVTVSVVVSNLPAGEIEAGR